jgi:hypothetical protein
LVIALRRVLGSVGRRPRTRAFRIGRSSDRLTLFGNVMVGIGCGFVSGVAVRRHFT